MLPQIEELDSVSMAPPQVPPMMIPDIKIAQPSIFAQSQDTENYRITYQSPAPLSPPSIQTMSVVGETNISEI